MIVFGCICGIVAMYLIVQLIYFKEIGKMRKAKAMGFMSLFMLAIFFLIMIKFGGA